MLIAWLALIVCIIGALAYALSSNPKIAEMGRIAYGVGLGVTLWHLATTVVHLP